jgi:hypothetical protein
MFSTFVCSRLLRASMAAAVLFCLAVHPPAAHAWGNEGHRMINRLAATNLPADVPVFLHAETAIDEIEYLGPEPDRWRSPSEPELVAVQAPEHFIDLEPADALGALPRKRLDFEAKVFAAGERPEKVGLQPWQTTEVWERLKVAMRDYRALTANHQDTKPAWSLRRRRIATASHHHPVQRLDGPQPQRLHHRPPDSLAVRRPVRRREHPRARCAGKDDARQAY